MVDDKAATSWFDVGGNALETPDPRLILKVLVAAKGSYAKAGEYIGIGRRSASRKAKISAYLNEGARLAGTPTATKIIKAWHRFLREDRQTSILDEATRVLDRECGEIRTVFNSAMEAEEPARTALLGGVESYSSLLLAAGRPVGNSARALVLMFRGLGALERGELERADSVLDEALSLSDVAPSIRDVVLHNSSYCKASLLRSALSRGDVPSAMEHAKSGMAHVEEIRNGLGMDEERYEAKMTFQVYLFLFGLAKTDRRARAARQSVLDLYMRRYSIKDEKLAVELWCHSHAIDPDADALRKVFLDYDQWMNDQEDSRWHSELR